MGLVTTFLIRCCTFLTLKLSLSESIAFGYLLLMEEILHHLRCTKPCKLWDNLYQLVQDFFHQHYGATVIFSWKSGNSQRFDWRLWTDYEGQNLRWRGHHHFEIHLDQRDDSHRSLGWVGEKPSNLPLSFNKKQGKTCWKIAFSRW